MMYSKIPALLPALFLCAVSSAQVFTANPNTAVPDDGQTYYFDLEVSGLPNTIDMSFGIERICMDFYHTWNDDIQFWLISPDGTEVELSTNNGGAEDNYSITCFTENAYLPITEGAPPYNGTFQPEGDLNNMNNGQDPNGTWQLKFYDTYWFADSGWLTSWSLEFTNEVVNPEPNPFEFDSSLLPLVYIDTFGQPIVDEPGTVGYVQVIDNGIGNINYTDDPYTYEGFIDIELRGQSTMGFPKKSYGFETTDDQGNDLDTTFLGLPAEEDWVLYAPYSEKSLLQNSLSMEIGRGMGQYHSRTRYCEVFRNGMYQGIYLLMEKIKRDNDRVDIANLDPNENTGDDVTGGYIFRLDWGGDTGWASEYNTVGDPNYYPYFQFVYPRPEVVSVPQQEYLQSYVDSFEHAVNNPTFSANGKRYDQFIDVNSFIDNFIVNEISKNVDAYRLSSYYYKDKDSNGGKIVAGPLWDFNLSFGNADYCDGTDVTDWMFESCGNIGPRWWPRFMQDTLFTNALYCRWTYLRTNILSNEYLEQQIDSMSNLLSEAADRNFERWPVLGIYVWPNPWPYAETYPEAIQQLKDWIFGRVQWLDENITGNPTCVPYVVNESSNFESFESGSFPPLCWTLADEDGDGTDWKGQAPVGGNTGNHSAYSESIVDGEINYDPDNYIITPQLAPQTGEHLTFYVSAQPGGYLEHYQVLLSTTGNDPADFDIVLWDEVIGGIEWRYRAADLEAWWGQDIYIAFRHFNSNGNLMVRIDDVLYPSFANPDDECFVGISETKKPVFEMFPNPYRDGNLTIRFERPGSYSIELRDVLGSLVHSWITPFGGSFAVDVSALPAGVYNTRILKGDFTSTLMLIVK